MEKTRAIPSRSSGPRLASQLDPDLRGVQFERLCRWYPTNAPALPFGGLRNVSPPPANPPRVPGYWRAMSQDNVELAHHVLDAFNRRDFDSFLTYMDPEVELKARFMEVEGEPYLRGHSGVREWWDALLAIFPDFRVEILGARPRRRSHSGIARSRPRPR